MIKNKVLDIRSTKVYNKWYNKLKDEKTKNIITAHLLLFKDYNFKDSKNVGDGVFELRIFIGGGIRIYYTFKNNTLILLLCGGDKSTQKRDIKKAKQLKKKGI